MAKAKKPGSTSAQGAAEPANKKKASKPPAVAASAPMIDTNLAAQAAAHMVAQRLPRANASAAAPRPETSAFKQLKESLNKPAAQGPASFLSSTAPAKKTSPQPFGGRNQVGHNQTFGADVNRTGIPRRTGG